MRIDKKVLIKSSMQIIKHTKDIRIFMKDAVEYAKKGDFLASNECMIAAKEKLKNLRHTKIKVMQEKMSEDNETYHLLFSYVQDILVSTSKEYNLSMQIIDLYCTVKDKRLENV